VQVTPPQDDAVAVITVHTAPVYSCAWSPAAADTFATGGGDDVAHLHRLVGRGCGRRAAGTHGVAGVSSMGVQSSPENLNPGTLNFKSRTLNPKP
jgi:ribosome assembly protein SQT1